MNRFQRRMHILKGKKAQGSFDVGQYYLESARRGRTARKLRHHLRRMTPVVLATPRWSQAHRFLDEIAVDLAVGDPSIDARTLSMAPIQGRTLFDTRTWLLRGLMEFCSLELRGPVTQAVDRNGFRHVLGELLQRADRGPHRALLLHGMEHVNVEAKEDLAHVFAEHVAITGRDRRLNLVMAGALDLERFFMPGAQHLTLEDFGETEAMENLTEWAGKVNREHLWNAVDLVGGVPALLDALGAHAEMTGHLAHSREEMWRALGPLADEIRGAVSIVVSDDDLAERLEEVARRGPVPEEPKRDTPLHRAGLIQRRRLGASDRVIMRAPVFTELAVTS